MSRYWIAVIVLCMLFAAFRYSVYLTENSHRGHIGVPQIGLFDPLRVVLPPFLGQNPDLTPLSQSAQAISIVALVIGVALVATMVGRVAVLFIERRERNKMPSDVHEHIVICNWNTRGDRIVKELHSSEMVPDTTIIVVADREVNEQELRTCDAYERVYFVRADPTLHDVLKRGARAHLARSVTILADDDCPDPDAKTALIAMAVTKLEAGQEEKPHIVAEVMNHRKTEHLADAGVDEWVCSADCGLGLIAQAAISKKITAVYTDLLSHQDDSCEIYIAEESRYDGAFVGKPFAEVAQFLNVHQNPANPAILIGVRRGGVVILNPKPEARDRVQKGDGLIVISYGPVDLRSQTNT